MTFEGDNTVLLQQAFNFLKKMAKRAMQEKDLQTKYDGVFSYMGEANELSKKSCSATKPEHWLNLDLIEEALKVNLSFKVQKLFYKMKESNSSKKDFVNSIAALDITKTSEEHIKFIMFLLFKRGIKD